MTWKILILFPRFEKSLLTNSAAPIVLLQAKQQETQNLFFLSNAIAPGSNLLGVMLPYTPLHSLICQQFGRPLVMTSGNISGEPQIINNISRGYKAAFYVEVYSLPFVVITVFGMSIFCIPAMDNKWFFNCFAQIV